MPKLDRTLLDHYDFSRVPFTELDVDLSWLATQRNAQYTASFFPDGQIHRFSYGSMGLMPGDSHYILEVKHGVPHGNIFYENMSATYADGFLSYYHPGFEEGEPTMIPLDFETWVKKTVDLIYLRGQGKYGLRYIEELTRESA